MGIKFLSNFIWTRWDFYEKRGSNETCQFVLKIRHLNSERVFFSLTRSMINDTYKAIKFWHKRRPPTKFSNEVKCDLRETHNGPLYQKIIKWSTITLQLETNSHIISTFRWIGQIFKRFITGNNQFKDFELNARE